jgi:hypothetical protein
MNEEICDFKFAICELRQQSLCVSELFEFPCAAEIGNRKSKI